MRKESFEITCVLVASGIADMNFPPHDLGQFEAADPAAQRH